MSVLLRTVSLDPSLVFVRQDMSLALFLPEGLGD